MSNPDACTQPTATVALAFAVGGVIGLAAVASRLFYPYRLHRFVRP